MTRRPYVLATAGHVDHGKSTVVRMLTGTDPDRLPEEKSRGMTIDLGFAHVSIEHGGTVIDASVIDVPGHEDFVKNMVAGVGAIDAALLVVAGDDGWMPQTQEHVDILTYSGVRRLLVVLTKADLAGDVAVATSRVRQRLAATPWPDAVIIPTTSRDMTTFATLRRAIGNFLTAVPPAADIGKPRLAVDRVFTVHGVGTVITGTLVDGSLRRGQSVQIRPAGATARIRGLQRFGENLEQTCPGTRVAVQLAPAGSAHDVRQCLARGATVSVSAAGVDVRTFDATLWRVSEGPPPLRDGLQVRVHHGTAAVTGRVRLLDRPTLPAGESAFARVDLAHPIHASISDRFIVRADSEQFTLAGGVILDVDPSPKRREAQRALLEQRAKGTCAVPVLIRTAVERDGIIDTLRLRSSVRVSDAAFDDAVRELIEAAVVRDTGAALVGEQLLLALRAEAAAVVDRFHVDHPAERGLPVSELRTLAVRVMLARSKRWADVLCKAVLDDLTHGGFSLADGVVARVSHRPSLPAELSQAGEALRRTLAERPFDPPSKKELCPTPSCAAAMRFLIRSGEVVEISDEVVLSAGAFADAVSRIRGYLDSGPAATVSELKDLLRSTRRVMVPLLERLDRDHVTHRVGNTRTLHRPRV